MTRNAGRSGNSRFNSSAPGQRDRRERSRSPEARRTSRYRDYSRDRRDRRDRDHRRYRDDSRSRRRDDSRDRSHSRSRRDRSRRRPGRDRSRRQSGRDRSCRRSGRDRSRRRSRRDRSSSWSSRDRSSSWSSRGRSHSRSSRDRSRRRDSRETRGRRDRSRRRDSQEPRRDRQDHQGQREVARRNQQPHHPLSELVTVCDIVFRNSRDGRSMFRRGMSNAESLSGNFANVRGVTMIQAVCDNQSGIDGRRIIIHSAIDRKIDREGDGVYHNFIHRAGLPPSSSNLRRDKRGKTLMDVRTHKLLTEHPLAGRVTRPFGADACPPAGPHPGQTCQACGITGHSVRICIWTSSEGDMPGCPFCELYDHHRPEDCQRRAEFDDEAVWQLFVINRGGKSHFRTRDPSLMWPNLVRQRYAQQPNELPPHFYPHSREYARECLFRDPNRHRVHNYRYEPIGLHQDPRTADRDSVMSDKDLAAPFQSGTERRIAAQHGTEDPVDNMDINFDIDTNFEKDTNVPKDGY